jgi:DNA transformation protein
MSTTPSFVIYVLDQLVGVGTVSARRMFGGIGLYQGELFFGAIDDDVVYLRVNDATRDEYLKRGMTALHPVKSKPDMATEAYYQLPSEVLDDADELPKWVRRAVAIAAAAPKKKKVRARKLAPYTRPKTATKPKSATGASKSTSKPKRSSPPAKHRTR